MLLCESITGVFNAVLGKIAGEALLDAVRNYTSLEVKDFAGNPGLVHEALTAHMGKAAKVLERRILRVINGKTLTGSPPVENCEFDFPVEISKAKEQFLRRKQAANHPRTLD